MKSFDNPFLKIKTQIDIVVNLGFNLLSTPFIPKVE